MLKIKSKGFTLIELLIVIAIIGILSSIVLVSLSSARNRAYRASALSTVTGLGTEIITCVDDNLTERMPASATLGGGRVCRDATPADIASHTVVWPTLANTGGYCYDNDGNNANGCGMANNATVLPNTFFLTDSDNAAIQCIWSATDNLTCS